MLLEYLQRLNSYRIGALLKIWGPELMIDAGARGSTDWINNPYETVYNDGETVSIVTGNGFVGNALRIASISGGFGRTGMGFYSIIKVSLKYRSNVPVTFGSIYADYIQCQANTGDAVTVNFTGYVDFFRFLPTLYPANVGDWLEMDELSIRVKL